MDAENYPDMISCAYCQSQVEDDSFFCDQCGKEIMICIECGRTGQGKCCDEDGSELVSAKSRFGQKENKSASQATDTLFNNPVIQSNDQGNVVSNIPQPQTGPATINNPPSPLKTNLAVPALRLVNTNLGLSLEITSGETIGRTTGPYAPKLAGFPGISGKHLVFSYDNSNGWSFRDIGSSNGTKYNKTNHDWQNTATTTVNIPVPVENKSYILIANVEFVIQIESLSNTGTQRL